MTTEIVQVEPDQNPVRNDGDHYKLLRFRIVELFERYTHDKSSALELMERYERGVMGALHLVAPSATSMREGFSVAAARFLDDK